MANNIVRLPIDYFPDPAQGRPVFNGSVYVGNPDTDPEILGNRKAVTLRQQDGTEVTITGAGQPLMTGNGGVILYNGSPVQVLCEGSYSIKVLSAKGSQVYYVGDALDGAPITGEDAVLKYDTVALAAASTTMRENNALDIAGRNAIGDGGGAMWRAVLTSGVTPNGIDIIVGTGNPLLSIQIRYSSTPLLETFGLAVSSLAAVNSAALARAIVVGTAGYRTEISGKASFDVPIVITGSGRKFDHGALTLGWTGATTSTTAFSLGDGSTSTQTNKFYNLKLTDDAGGVETLLQLWNANRNQFYSKVLTANNTPSVGRGMLLRESFINSFYGPGYFSCNDAIEFGDNTNANNWYDINIEGAQRDGFVVPTGVNVNRNAVFGGVIEGVVANGAHITAPGNGLSFNDTYFEANGNSVLYDTIAAETVPVTLTRCRFKADTEAASIKVTGPGRLIVEGCDANDKPLIECTNASAWVRGVDNISKTGEDEFLTGSIGNLSSTSFNGANVKNDTLRSFELAGIRVPVAQTGTQAGFPAAGSVTVTFATPFLNTPAVFSQPTTEHTLGNAANIIAVGITTNQVTFRNRGTESVDFNWAAFDVGDLN